MKLRGGRIAYIVITKKMNSPILTLLANHDDPRVFFESTKKFIFGNCYMNIRVLRDWADKITTHPKSDPAKLLLDSLVCAQTPSMVSMLCNPDFLMGPLFDDIMRFNGITDEWTMRDIQNNHTLMAHWISSCNEIYDEDEEGDFHQTILSQTLSHVSDYLKGHLYDVRKLMYSFSGRIWKKLTDNQKNALYSTTFFLHAYHFYYTSESDDIKEFKGISTDRYILDSDSHLMSFATVKCWEDGRREILDGHDDFGILPRITNAVLGEICTDKSCGFTHTISFGTDNIDFVDRGDDGITITQRTLHGKVLHYALYYDDKYESALSLFFEKLQDSPYVKIKSGHPAFTKTFLLEGRKDVVDIDDYRRIDGEFAM